MSEMHSVCGLRALAGKEDSLRRLLQSEIDATGDTTSSQPSSLMFSDRMSGCQMALSLAQRLSNCLGIARWHVVPELCVSGLHQRVLHCLPKCLRKRCDHFIRRGDLREGVQNGRKLQNAQG